MKARERFGLMVIVTVLILGIGLFFGVTVCAKRETEQETSQVQNSGYWMYHRIEVEEGDTLWCIAEEYARPELGMNRHAYIEKVKKANKISGDTIYAGGTLVVPVYVESWQ